jgi:ORF6N domain
MLDFHLAEIYKVPTKIFNKAVAKNRLRFPEDFFFQLTSKEWNSLRFQIGTSNIGGPGGEAIPSQCVYRAWCNNACINSE